MIPVHRPDSLAEACSLLDTLDQPMVYGGGTAIQILIKQGVLFAESFVDISAVPGLGTIEETADGFRVGPMVSVRRMETDQRVRARSRLASLAYGRVANPRVRNTASVGGNIAHGDYRLDPPTALLALDARVGLTSVRGSRTVPAREFFVDFQLTAVERGELITSIEVPAAPRGAGTAYVKLSSLSENDWPAASVAALLDRGTDPQVLRLGVGALAPVPRFVEVDVTGLDLEQTVKAAADVVDPLLDPIADVRGSAAYKRQLGLVATQDAVRQAWEDGNA
jgi:carbon-monoxide dehydrogenase medium subunit